MSVASKKICLIGDFGVGKTSLVRRYVDRQFKEQYLSTIGVKISRKLVEIPTAPQAVLQFLIWDIEGATAFKNIAAAYLQGAKGAIVVADLTRPKTLESLTDHIQRFELINPTGWIAIALNKFDLIQSSEQDKLARSLQLPGSEKILAIQATSARTGTNVDSLFYALALRMLESTISTPHQ